MGRYKQNEAAKAAAGLPPTVKAAPGTRVGYTWNGHTWNGHQWIPLQYQPAPAQQQKAQHVSGLTTGGHIAFGILTFFTAGLAAPLWWLAWYLGRRRIR